MERKVKIGIIGCGAVAQVEHIPAFSSIPDAEIAMICDTDERKLSYLKKKYNIPSTSSRFEDVIRNKDIDGVVIATPNYLHSPMVIAALEYNKFTLCEKPLGLNTKEIEEIGRVAEKHPHRLMYGLNDRFRQDVQVLRKYISGGELGEIFYAKTGWLRKLGGSIEEWRKDRVKSGGGVVLNLGVHLLDVVLWILPKKVHRVFASIHYNDGIEDSGVAIIRFQDGTFLTLEVAYTLLFERDFTYFNLFGEKGSALLNPLKIQKIQRDKLVDITPRISSKKLYKSSFTLQAEWFVDMIKRDRKPLFDWKDALTISRVIDALYKSADENKEIKLN